MPPFVTPLRSPLSPALPSGSWSAWGAEGLQITLVFSEPMDQLEGIGPYPQFYITGPGTSGDWEVDAYWTDAYTLVLSFLPLTVREGVYLLDYVPNVHPLKTLAGVEFPAWSDLSVSSA